MMKFNTHYFIFGLVIVVLISGCAQQENKEKVSEDFVQEENKFIPPQEKHTPPEDYFADIAYLPSCGDKKELLSASPLELSDFTTITPLGLLYPTAHVIPSPHLYLTIRGIDPNPNNHNSPPVKVSIFAPADLTITKIKFIEARGHPEVDDGAIEFGICREFKAYLDHLKTLSPKIKQIYEDAQTLRCDEYSLTYAQPVGKLDFKVCQKLVDIKIQKGEMLGTGGEDTRRILDFGAFDRRVTPKQFANPDRFRHNAHHNYLVCALDYYPENLKTELKSRLGGYIQDGREIRGADCGEVIQDIPGTAMGIWAPSGIGSFGHDPPYLALAHENIEPQYLVVNMGDSAEKAGLRHGKYTFLPKNEGMVNRHFKDITSDGKVYCFETVDTYPNRGAKINILLDMPSPTRLRIQKYDAASCGSDPWNLTNYAEFER